MDVFNAIGKVRFSSSKAQRVQLAPGIDLLCFEPGQKLHFHSGASYYVVTGSAQISSDGRQHDVPPAQMAVAAREEEHTVTNAGEVRLICLSYQPQK